MKILKYSRQIVSRIISTLVVVALVLLICTLHARVTARDAIDSEGRLNIVTTTAILRDLIECVGGDAVSVTGLMGPGIDPHLYQASAGDVLKMQNADVVVYNGLHLESKMADVFSSLEGVGKAVICAGEGIDKSELLARGENQDAYDPHIWFDVSLWKLAAEHVAAGLITADPLNETTYKENLNSYIAELDELDAYIKERVLEIPEQQRVLITAHDAFKYFGAAYGFEVRGLQGISTNSEAGTSDVSNLAKHIAENRIKAIFTESSVPVKNIQALKSAVEARGFAVTIGGELYSDSLGDENSGHDTYILTFKANIDTIVEALK